jgi:ribosomal protein S18 acetylase RimI-like enzyme
MNIEIIKADYSNQKNAIDLGNLLAEYAKDPMAGNFQIAEELTNNLARKLSEVPNAFSILAYSDSRAAGFVNCFQTFSTFKCKPVINIHDVYVNKAFRGQKISQLMIQKVEEIAKEKGACKLTLEVLEKNIIAQNSYRKLGFIGYELDPKLGKALFWEKEL